MSRAKTFADQLKRVWGGDAWHGPNIQALVADVTPEQAAAKPLPRAHSIFEIVLHMTTWDGVAFKRLMGEKVDEVDDAKDWPDPGAATWGDARNALITTSLRLREAVLQLKDEDFEKKAPGSSSTQAELLRGIVDHDLYHSGQIALLRKGLGL